MTDSSVDQLNQCLHCFSVQSNQDHLNWVSNKPQWRFIWPSDESSHSQQKAKSCTTLPTLSRQEEGRTDPLAALLAHCRPSHNCLPQGDLPYHCWDIIPEQQGPCQWHQWDIWGEVQHDHDELVPASPFLGKPCGLLLSETLKFWKSPKHLYSESFEIYQHLASNCKMWKALARIVSVNSFALFNMLWPNWPTVTQV